MKNRQLSLNILQDFIAQCDNVRNILLLKHEVALNWSQIYKTTHERRKAIKEVYAEYNKDVKEYWLEKSEFLRQSVKDLELACKEKEVFSVASLVEANNKSYLHLPLMNLHPRSGVTVKELIIYLKDISSNRKGVLLRTGRYFHYIGYYLLTNEEWITFLGKMLAPFIFVNPGYIGYSLLRGYCCIRLTAAKEIKKVTPYKIKEV